MKASITFDSNSNAILCTCTDSNGEDLEGYAGAGLYDSITMDASALRKVRKKGAVWCVSVCCGWMGAGRGVGGVLMRPSWRLASH